MMANRVAVVLQQRQMFGIIGIDEIVQYSFGLGNEFAWLIGGLPHQFHYGLVLIGDDVRDWDAHFAEYGPHSPQESGHLHCWTLQVCVTFVHHFHRSDISAKYNVYFQTNTIEEWDNLRVGFCQVRTIIQFPTCGHDHFGDSAMGGALALKW